MVCQEMPLSWPCVLEKEKENGSATYGTVSCLVWPTDTGSDNRGGYPKIPAHADELVGEMCSIYSVRFNSHTS